MSDLMIGKTGHSFFREKLLTTVCGLALLACAGTTEKARADEADHPTVWIELGGQLERMGGGQEAFTPPFLGSFEHLNFDSVLPLQRPPLYSNGAEGKISLLPRGSDWVLSATLRYGRSNGLKEQVQQLPALPRIKGKTIGGAPLYITQVEPYHLNARTQNADRHLVLDFQAGKDVGLGLFSRKGFSDLSLGVRFAQFTSSRSATISGVPDFVVVGTNAKYGIQRTRHRYSASLDVESSFHGVGPSLSWDASAPLSRDDDNQISLDWGVSAAVLFGRQKANGQSNVTGTHYSNYVRITPVVARVVNDAYHHPVGIDRSRSVTVPNVGGFAGISFRYSDVKVSMGYRADVYFGAIDGGIEARKTEDRSFYGPFATFSIGLGG